VLAKPFIVRGHSLTQDLADRRRYRWRFKQIKRDAQKQGPRARRPEGVDIRRIGIEHLGNALQVIDAL